MLRHYHRLQLDICSEQAGKKILEIASNDGSCLRFFKQKEFEVLGFDPARNLAESAAKSGVPTVPEFFDQKTAGCALSEMGVPDVILARHVFAHVDDWRGFFSGLAMVAEEKTLIVLEFPYVLDLLRNVSWDTIYHEHLSFISLKPILALLRDTPFHIHRVTRVGIHAGAVVVMLRHNSHQSVPHLSADEFVAEEQVTEDHWKEFSEMANQKIRCLQALVSDLREKGDIVSIFGASAKTTVLCRACGFDKDSISFCTDNSPLKPGKLIPGTSIPIIEEGQMLSEHPDHAIVGAWNFRDAVMANTSKYRARGGKLIFPTRDGWETV